MHLSNDAINGEKRGLIYSARLKLNHATIHLEQKTVNLSRGMWLRTKGSGIRIAPGAPIFKNLATFRSGFRFSASWVIHSAPHLFTAS